VEEEDFERHRGAEMVQLYAVLAESMEPLITHPPHGYVPEERRDGVFRGLLVQLNSMVTRQVKNRKARMLKNVVQKYGVQFVGLGEVGVNLKKAKVKRLLSLLPDLGLHARCSTAHNPHENFAVHQQGGVATIVLGKLLNYYKKGKKNFRNLGRWDSFILQSVDGHRTRVVQAYAVQAVRSKRVGSVDQQHVRYIQRNGFGSITPRELFERDLFWQLQVWRALWEIELF
jgi:hypothetical protein